MNSNFQKIQNLYKQLIPLKIEEDCYMTFDKIVSEMTSVIEDLLNGANDENLKVELINTKQCLLETLNNEVEMIKYHENKMNKKNATKVRRKEYFVAVNEAITQINLDLSNMIH